MLAEGLAREIRVPVGEVATASAWSGVPAGRKRTGPLVRLPVVVVDEKARLRAKSRWPAGQHVAHKPAGGPAHPPTMPRLCS
jgi:hypothetical protein